MFNSIFLVALISSTMLFYCAHISHRNSRVYAINKVPNAAEYFMTKYEKCRKAGIFTTVIVVISLVSPFILHIHR